MKSKLLAIAVLALAPTIVFAQPGDRSGDERPRFGRMFGERESEEIAKFMAEHAPNRWTAAQGLPDEMRRGVVGFITARYRAINQLRDDDQELYDIKVRQLSVEDDIYGLVANVRDPARREQDRERIEQAVNQLLELNIAEREHRLKRLKSEVQEEEQRLEADRKALESQVQLKTDALVNDGAAGLRRDMRWERPRRDRPGSDRPGDRPGGDRPGGDRDDRPSRQ